MMPTSQELVRIEGTIPPDLAVRDGMKFLFISKDQRAFTHGLHKYPAKFFPELPRWIIERYSQKGDFILDPFAGSGTTNLEAMMLGRDSVGVDVDPFSRFLARTKTKLLSENELWKAYTKIKKISCSYHENSHINGVPDFPYRDQWFKGYILKELAYIKNSIEILRTSQEIKNFFLVCFSSVVRQVSEADNNCTRTVIRKKLGKQVLPNAAINLFVKRIDVQVFNMISFVQAKPQGQATIPDDTDARDMSVFKGDLFDLALTSPPYLNAVDYPRTHQLEMYWLGLATGSLQPLKRLHVGTEAVFRKEYESLHKTGVPSADRAIKRIYELDPRRAFIATKYINDMIKNLEEVYRTLKKGGAYVMVIGNNLVRGIEFETWRYLEEVAPKVGYKVECHFVSTIINHFIKLPRKERINDDYILVLRK